MAKNYNQLFEDLMQYTNFNSSKDIKTQKDLFEFFKQVKDDSKGKGRLFKVSTKMFKAISGVIIHSSLSKQEIRQKRIENMPIIRDFKVIKTWERHEVVNRSLINPKGQRVFKTAITFKGKSQLRWRTLNGRFASKPIDKIRTHEFGGQKA